MTKALTKAPPQLNDNNLITNSDNNLQIRMGADSMRFENVVPCDDSQEYSTEERARKLLHQIDRYFNIVAETLYDNQALQTESLQRLQEAKELIWDKRDDLHTLSIAQFKVHTVHVAIAQEQQLRLSEQRLQAIVPALILVYVAGIVSLILFGGRYWNATTDLPIIGIPVSVVVWAAIGSLAAILYRFYTRSRVRLSTEVRWLIARPIIGIIMGSLAYVAVVSGLLIFNGTDSANAMPVRQQLFWLLAFLGGFSDKFFESVIHQVVGKFTTEEETPTNRINPTEVQP